MNADSNVLYFCGAGKDRTGVVSAVILRRLGFGDQVIIDDYMASKDNLMGFLTAYVEEHPEVDINIIVPNEDNIKKVIAALNRHFPTREEAEALVAEAEKCNPGPWGNHSRTAAHCAGAIAERSGMDAEKAYVLGLLHDIGRKFGKRHLGHVSDGYSYMMSLGYEDAAKICLTHSFNEKNIDKYVGRFDTTEEETTLIRRKLAEVELDDYDRLIQLCDAISGAEGVMDIIDRMTDVKNRYGAYDPDKWNMNLWLKKYFENKMGMDLYKAVGKESRTLPIG